MSRYDTYTGGEHYWIMFRNGIHKVFMETPDFMPENEIVFVGHYEDCVDWINNEVRNNFEYDMNL